MDYHVFRIYYIIKAGIRLCIISYKSNFVRSFSLKCFKKILTRVMNITYLQIVFLCQFYTWEGGIIIIICNRKQPIHFVGRKIRAYTIIVLRVSVEGNKLMGLLGDRQLNAVIKSDVVYMSIFITDPTNICTLYSS